ncbi:MAG: chromate resistance protein [Metallibacterium scheffleri]|nr:chromate resistance protein ChrB domain-containing protein [Metallibacterium scheffleri]MCK9368326.1 chromate resistance protein [Metallibacterium scheffleri]
MISLPGPTKAARMRLWRALRLSGAGALRDGVYLLPNSPSASAQFATQAAEVVASGGSAETIAFGDGDATQQQRLLALFDRGDQHARLIERAQAVRAGIGKGTDADVRRRLATLRREAAALSAIDFFPGPAAAQLEQALGDAEAALAAVADGGEPRARQGSVPRRDIARYQKRLWATRRNLWVDRVASAWLIRRFIDAQARFRWLRQPEDCPKTAVGFDFDGAEFSHVGGRVTFEVLLASFSLDKDPALVRLGTVVHALDVGGAPAAEAAGLAAIMAGYRAKGLSDDALLVEASGVFDALHAAFQGAEDSTS